MANRSRNMRRGRRMRGGVDGVNGVGPVVKRADQVVEGADQVVATPDSNSWFASIPGLDSATEGASSFFSGAAGEVNQGTDYLKKLLPGTGPVEAPGSGTVVANGGKRRSKQMRMKGGRGLGLDYYATSVNGIKVAHPTYMEYYKGGKRRSSKRRRSCKKRRSKRSRRRSCKR